MQIRLYNADFNRVWRYTEMLKLLSRASSRWITGFQLVADVSRHLSITAVAIIFIDTWILTNSGTSIFTLDEALVSRLQLYAVDSPDAAASAAAESIDFDAHISRQRDEKIC